MIVRIEEVRDSDVVLVIDKPNKYMGRMFYSDFASCVDSSKEEIVENDFIYWYVDKKLINKYLNNERTTR